jgi:hypothetical protein
MSVSSSAANAVDPVLALTIGLQLASTPSWSIFWITTESGSYMRESSKRSSFFVLGGPVGMLSSSSVSLHQQLQDKWICLIAKVDSHKDHCYSRTFCQVPSASAMMLFTILWPFSCRLGTLLRHCHRHSHHF